MGRRTLLIIASVLVAAAGTAMIWLYVQGADARARSRWQSLVTVLVATKPIPVGSGADSIKLLTEPVQVPRDFVPDKPVTDLKSVKGQTTKMPVLAGQFLVEGQFVADELTAGVPDGRMAVAFAMDDPNRVASLLRPGSEVAVYTTVTDKGSKTVKNLLPKVTVLGVGTATALRNGDGSAAKVGTQSGVSTALVTLDVSGKEATKLIAAGSLYFTLLGKGAQGSDKDTTTVPLGAGTGSGNA